MIPALAVIGFGRRRVVPLPIPFFLLWPLILLALGAVGLAGRFTRRRQSALGDLAAAKTALLATFHLSGLRIDARWRDSGKVYVRFI